MPYVKGVDRNQTTLFPESIEDYITSDNPVRVINVYVEQLDMGALKFNFATAPSVGRPPYNPRIMLKLFLYGYLNRIRSSRCLEHEAKRNVELLWLLQKQAPDFKTIADFRKNNKKAIKEIFKDFVRFCKEWDLFGKETVAVDGSKFRASNSKKNNYNKKKIERHSRNPWRFSFDPATGLLWAGDVGQNAVEEITIIENGKNYGWNIMEGSQCYNPPAGCDSTGLEMPVYEYLHPLGRSITGGYVCRGSELPLLEGAYIYADFVTGLIWALWYEDAEVKANYTLAETGLNISSFGVDEDNELYLTAFDSKVYRLVNR